MLVKLKQQRDKLHPLTSESIQCQRHTLKQSLVSIRIFGNVSRNSSIHLAFSNDNDNYVVTPNEILNVQEINSQFVFDLMVNTPARYIKFFNKSNVAIANLSILYVISN